MSTHTDEPLPPVVAALKEHEIPMPRDYLDVRYISVDSQLVPPEMLMTWHAQIGSLRTQLEGVKALLKEAIDVFESMNDDEITEDLLPHLREGLRPTRIGRHGR